VIVAFDASILTYIIDENAKPPTDPATLAAVTFCKERVRYLLDTLQQAGAKIIIPTPALAEVLVKAGAAASTIVSELTTSKHFRVVDFDVRAAVEFAARQSIRPRGVVPRTKAKFDDQILAIATVENAVIIYSDDGDIASAAPPNMTVIGIAALEVPPAKAQHEMFDGLPEETYSSNPDYGRF
jgi:hypothetical protein